MDSKQWYRLIGHLFVVLMVLRVISACPQTLTNLTGSFSTPNYPSNYDNDIDCSWTIKVPEGYVITLRFTDFKVENTILCAFSCVCDYIELHDLTVNGVERNHGRFCMWNPPPKSFVSTSNQLRITFHSDFNHADKGFRAVYTSSFKGILPPKTLSLSTTLRTHVHSETNTGKAFTVSPSNETLVTSNSTNATSSPTEATSSVTGHPKTTESFTKPTVETTNGGCKDCSGRTTTIKRNKNASIPSSTPELEDSSRIARWTVLIVIILLAVIAALCTVLAVVCLRKRRRRKSKTVPPGSIGTRFSFTSAFKVIDLHCNKSETDLVVKCPIYEGTYASVVAPTKGTDNPLYESSGNATTTAKRTENPLYDQVV